MSVSQRKRAIHRKKIMKNSNKIVRYPKTLNLNIGVLFFAIIFLYLMYNVYAYMTTKHISFYEVTEGSIKLQTAYTGLALREENIVFSDTDGFINYYLRDNSRAKKGSLICSVDENGDIANQISTATAANNSLDSASYDSLIDEMKDYSNAYSNMTFYNSYIFKEDLKAELMEAVNLSALNSMSGYAANASEDHTFHLEYANEPGIVAYYADDYELVTTDNFTPGMLSDSTYQKNNLKSNNKVAIGDPLYKLITSEQWNLVFEIDETLSQLMKDDSVVRVRFKADETTSWATYEIRNINGQKYMILTFNNSMIRYASMRFLDIELILDKQDGLKISNDSIVEKEFYKVPQNLFIKGGNSNSLGILLYTTDDKGETVQKFVATDIYDSDDENYYISEEEVTAGTKIANPTGGDSYIISDSKTLQGVYNINKGYAVFRVINILYQNEEYTIVAKNTPYGISLYDHIALDGSSCEEGQIIR